MELGVHPYSAKDIPLNQKVVGKFDNTSAQVPRSAPLKVEGVVWYSRSTDQSGQWVDENSPTHPRYSFVIHGCSSKVYVCIDKLHDDIYHRLLRN